MITIMNMMDMIKMDMIMMDTIFRNITDIGNHIPRWKMLFLFSFMGIIGDRSSSRSESPCSAILEVAIQTN